MRAHDAERERERRRAVAIAVGVLIGGVGLLLLAFTSKSPALNLTVTALFLAIVVAAGQQLGRIERRLRRETAAARMERLTAALSEAATAIDEIGQEIAERTALVEKLEADLERYNELAHLKRAEVEAVAQALRGELRVEGRRSLLQNTIINVLLVGAGAVLGHFIA